MRESGGRVLGALHCVRRPAERRIHPLKPPVEHEASSILCAIHREYLAEPTQPLYANSKPLQPRRFV